MHSFLLRIYAPNTTQQLPVKQVIHSRGCNKNTSAATKVVPLIALTGTITTINARNQAINLLHVCLMRDSERGRHL